MKCRQRVIGASPSIAFPVSFSASVLANVSSFPSRTLLLENERGGCCWATSLPCWIKIIYFRLSASFPETQREVGVS